MHLRAQLWTHIGILVVVLHSIEICAQTLSPSSQSDHVPGFTLTRSILLNFSSTHFCKPVSSTRFSGLAFAEDLELLLIGSPCQVLNPSLFPRSNKGGVRLFKFDHEAGEYTPYANLTVPEDLEWNGTLTDSEGVGASSSFDYGPGGFLLARSYDKYFENFTETMSGTGALWYWKFNASLQYPGWEFIRRANPTMYMNATYAGFGESHAISPSGKYFAGGVGSGRWGFVFDGTRRVTDIYDSFTSTDTQLTSNMDYFGISASFISDDILIIGGGGVGFSEFQRDLSETTMWVSHHTFVRTGSQFGRRLKYSTATSTLIVGGSSSGGAIRSILFNSSGITLQERYIDKGALNSSTGNPNIYADNFMTTYGNYLALPAFLANPRRIDLFRFNTTSLMWECFGFVEINYEVPFYYLIF